MKITFGLFLFLIVITGSCVVYSSEPPFIVGVNTKLYNLDKHKIKENIDTAYSLGINAIRTDLPWSDVETVQGEYHIPENWDYLVNYSNHVGIKVLAILDYGNKFYDNGDKPLSEQAIKGFSSYVSFLTNHFKNRISFYQIWNEWNGKVGNTTPGSVSSYKKLVIAAYPVIKENSPHSVIITGSFSSASFNKAIGLENKGDYLREFLSPDMTPYTDALSIHPYTTYRKYPFNKFSYYTKQITYAKTFLNNSIYHNKPIYITEIGWSTSDSPYGVSPQTQKDNISKSICEAKKRGYAGVFIYNLVDSKPSFNTEDGFGLLDYKFKEKPAALMIKGLECN